MPSVLTVLRWLGGAVALAVVAIVAVRAVEAVRDPALAPWHRYAPEEPTAEAIAEMDWSSWLAAEGAVFEAMRAKVVEPLDSAYHTRENRYFEGSPLHPGGFAVDWNRSYAIVPEEPPRGVAVLVHGLTDGPFSLRHIAEAYRAAGFVAVVPRMPGHGTTPAGLTAASWPDWMAATRMAVRAARAMADRDAPLHLVGYSNGGALVTKYALEALDDPTQARPAQVVLISPMIGVTAFARFAGLAGWPAVVPGFLRAAWLDILPEFNPFKYNSFPVHAAVQSHRLTQAVQADLRGAARSGAIGDMPPVLAFQSVVDSTVSARALVVELFGRLPENGSELVLFDLNRAATLAPVIGAAADAALERIAPPPPRTYGLTVVTNAGPDDRAAVARVEPAGVVGVDLLPLGVDYPADVFSLSHVALPFPMSDGLYGLEPDPDDAFGISLGTLAGRGETGVLRLGAETFARLTSNPFFDLMLARIVATTEGPK